MTPEPVLRFTREPVDGAATSADVGEVDDDVVETEDDGSQHQRRQDHPDTAGGRQAPPPASHRCHFVLCRCYSVARLLYTATVHLEGCNTALRRNQQPCLYSRVLKCCTVLLRVNVLYTVNPKTHL